jgi:multidrug efflux system membrane fusion protein
MEFRTCCTDGRTGGRTFDSSRLSRRLLHPQMPDLSQQDPAYMHQETPAPAPLGADLQPPPARSSSLRLILVLTFIALVGVVIGWRIHSSNVQTKADADMAAAFASQPIPVQVALVQRKTVPVALSALGTVTAYNTVNLNSRVSGQILRVNFTEGQAVHRGQLLIQIDPAPYQAALDQALGQLARDQANLKNAQAEADRYNALYAAGVTSKESQQLQVSNAGQAAGAIASDRAAIETARINLAYTRIESPIDGIVGLRQVDPGNIVNAGQTNNGSSSTSSQSSGLVVITQVHPIAVIFTLPEDQLPEVQRAMRSGKPLAVEAYDRSDAHLIASGTLLTIDNQIDTTTGTAKLKAVFTNADNSLFANQFVNVRLTLSERPDALVIPTSAVVNGTKGDFVFVVNPGPTPESKRKNLPLATATSTPVKDNAQFHADSTPVHVDFTLGTTSVLTEGTVRPGQQVIVDGQEKLVDGGEVSPSNAIPAAQGAQP